MKKILPVAAALVLALAGCSSAPKTEEATNTEPEVVEETVEEAAEEEADQGLIIEWVDVKTADEAAEGAGFDKFGVIDKFTLGDLEFANPTFAYAGGVARATYETPATAVFICKGVGSYSTPLSERQLDTFAAKWFKVYDGTEITCYGVAKGAVTVATWTDGFKSYAVTFQGLGGEEMSMDTDELATIVKGINEANADQRSEEEQKAEEKKAEEKKEEASSETKTSSLISAKDAEAMVEKDSGGTCTAIDLVSTKQYGDCWYATAVDKSGVVFAYYIDNNGLHLVSKTAPEKKEEKKDEKKSSEEHYEGEPVTIYGSVYAEWHKNSDGKWYATFTTFNGTQILATTAPAGGGWVFYALSNGERVQVIYSDQESKVTGEVGPGGVSSHWQGLDNKKWY